VKLKKLSQCLALAGFASCVAAQTTDISLQRVEITGSSIKRIAAEGSLPVQIITSEDLKRQGITTAEQLMSTLSVNGNGLDNLASNSDVAAGSGRGSNGLSAANLRGQGSNNTLVLLNGRRLAAHGLNGGTVDLNQIPMAAIERIEILKDGASAIYGTDAIGGVINFILKKNYTGVQMQASTDFTQQGGGNINRVSLTGGTGDLDKDKYNVLFSLSHSANQALFGSQRSFVNDFQSSRGLSPDTTGAPYATLQTLSTLTSVLSNKSSTGPVPVGGVAQRYINPLNLPGGAGCGSVAGMAPYDYALWGGGANHLEYKYGCTFDTGVAATLQQPVDNTNLVARGTLAVGEHHLYAEVTAARVTSAKVFSASQLSSSTTAKVGTAPNQIANPLYNMAYPLNAVNKATYDSVFNQLVATFPSIAANYGLPMAFKWRCDPCGPRQYDTTSDTARFMIGADGPVPWLTGWDYRAGVSTAKSESSSVLGNGYYFGVPLVAAIATGGLNPFLPAGQSQTPAALAALAAASANGTTLYGGKFTLIQADATASGPVFKLPAGDVMAAVGVDMRSEKFAFNGNPADWAQQLGIPNAAFDSINTLDTVKRDVKAVFTEVMIPITKQLEATLALRHDDYTGFGGTNNPKIALRYTPVEQFLVRGSYNTGFRVPDFKQQFFGVTESPGGTTTVDPATCPTLKVSALPGCSAITFTTLFGGNVDLQPEKSKQSTVGFVWAPTSNASIGADWWSINKTGTIQAATITNLLNNYALFPQNFIRDASGNIVQIDTSWINAGETVTKGIDINASANGKMGEARWGVSLEGSYLLDKVSRVVASAPFGASEVGQFNPNGDPGIRWKHSLTGVYTRGPWTGTLTQLYRSGYKQNVIYAAGYTPTDWNPDVASYTLYNASVSYSGVKNLDLTFGIKNLFNREPPFAITYDTNTGAGSSWDPRVADPRGRSFNLIASYKFL
jgi:iron complex outermembrane receptor protein